MADPTEDDLDDLDDLDDILDEFEQQNGTHKDAVEPLTAAAAAAKTNGLEREDEFANQLQAGMAELMRELEQSPETREQFQGLVSEIANATSASAGTTSSTTRNGPPQPNGTKSNFNDKIAQAAHRIKESHREADKAAASSETDDFLADMLKQLESAAGGVDGETDFSDMLTDMMARLTHKEILYEPMKDLDTKFPAWIAANTGKQTSDAMGRYREQYQQVHEIVAKFEEPTYSDADETHSLYITERMQRMQELGSPPLEIMNEMTDGLETDTNGMPKLPPELGACPVQ